MTLQAPTHEKEIIGGPVNLCTARGRLNREAVGWSRFPIHRCNLSGSWGRKKKWNYWCITSPTHLFSVTLSTLDYAGLAFIYVLDFESGEFHEKSVLVPLALGCAMPESVQEDIHFEHSGLRLAFRSLERAVKLEVECPDFAGDPLKADLSIEVPENHETLSVVVPWDDRRFQYTSKHNTLPTSGSLEALGRHISFDAEEAFACLDFGRGIWPYSSFWNWAAGSGRVDGRTIGLNFGAGWTDGTGSTENGICIDGRLTKIGEDVAFEYDSGDFKKPWRLRTRSSNRVELLFVPFYERIAISNTLIIRSEVHQCIGRFEGTVRTETGEDINVRDLIGWAEEHQARW